MKTEILKKSEIRSDSSFKYVITKYFKKYTGHNIKCLSSFENFVEFMHSPTDAASLGIGRMLFGIMMIIDIPEERSGGSLDLRWGEPNDCRFPLFDSLKPLSLPRMGILYLIMWLGALGIAVGHKFRISCLMFVIPYWYIFFLDKSAWNNHSYLYGLIGTLLLTTEANRFGSIESWKASQGQQIATVPFWNYFIIKYQFFILYFVAGLKKFSAEWLSGYAMENLSYHWVFAPFRCILGAEMTDLLIIHWFGCIFDLSVAFFLIYERTRPCATIFATAFHLMNSRLFTIGMFPWVCLAELPLFYSAAWPRSTRTKIIRIFSKTNSDLPEKKCCNPSNSPKPPTPHLHTDKKVTVQQKFVVILMLTYCGAQAFVPYSHFITEGYNNWTDGLYGYSWDMMVHAWDTILISIKVVDNNNQRYHFLEPYIFTETERWTKHADMAYQYAHCIRDRLEQEFLNNEKSILSSTNISIYFDIWSSLNGRFQQRIFNPYVDILQANWSAWQRTDWVLPLLEFTHMRPKMNEITKDVLSWSNYTDILFIADFPGYTMHNYITLDLDNVTLSVLHGTIRYEIAKSNITISVDKGQSIDIDPGIFHRVITISDTPSCYVYIFVNKTMQNLEKKDVTISEHDPDILPLWDEFIHRYDNFVNFFAHIGNSLLYEIYSVPMPRRLREVNNN